MDKKIFIANWKSHKTVNETKDFLDGLKEGLKDIDLSNKEIILAPSYTALMMCGDYISKHSLPIKLSSQSLSSYPEGAYTGEVNAKQIKEFADYVIVGHSERKRYLNENENDIESKIKEAKDVGLKVIQCIQDENSELHKGSDIVAFEPPNAISTFGVGEPETPEHIMEVFNEIKDRLHDKILIYGGSVDAENIKSYAEIGSCKGFLIGSASLEVTSFLSLLSQW